MVFAILQNEIVDCHLSGKRRETSRCYKNLPIYNKDQLIRYIDRS